MFIIASSDHAFDDWPRATPAQALINERQFMDATIPRHSGAMLIYREATPSGITYGI